MSIHGRIFLVQVLIFILLFLNVAQAQTVSVIRNDNATTTIQSNNLGVSKLATNNKGVLYVSLSAGAVTVGDIANITTSVTPGTSAAHLGKAEDAAHVSGDTGVAAWGVINSGSLLTFGQGGDYSPIGTTAQGAVMSVMSEAFQPSQGAYLLKLEDTAAASGDAGVAALGVVNEGYSGAASAGQYASHALTTEGAGINTIVYDAGIASTSPRQPAILEDDPSQNQDAMFKVASVSQDPLTVDQGTNGDWGPLKMDRAGRTITTMAPAGESWQACTSPMTGTGHVSIKAAVASNRIYITHITCSNTSAVASLVYIEDGTTPIYVGGVGASTTEGIGNWSATLPIPLRLTSNTALQVAMVTNATATTCCASGYISVN